MRGKCQTLEIQLQLSQKKIGEPCYLRSRHYSCQLVAEETAHTVSLSDEKPLFPGYPHLMRLPLAPALPGIQFFIIMITFHICSYYSPDEHGVV